MKHNGIGYIDTALRLFDSPEEAMIGCLLTNAEDQKKYLEDPNLHSLFTCGINELIVTVMEADYLLLVPIDMPTVLDQVVNIAKRAKRFDLTEEVIKEHLYDCLEKATQKTERVYASLLYWKKWRETE